MSPPTLHLICGKVASGKSTLCADLGSTRGTVVISEDDWLHALYADQMVSLSDYVRCAAKLRQIAGPHIIDLLNAGTSVVLDFQANTVESRRWMRELLAKTNADARLHVLDVPDETCIARLHARNAAGTHPFAATEQQFHEVSRHFVPPSPDEGFQIVMHPAAET